MMRYYLTRHFRLLISVCLLQLTLVSCSSLQRPDPPTTAPLSTAEHLSTSAELALQQHDYATAADLFRQLAATQTGEQRDIALLYSANAELLADDSNVQWVRRTLNELSIVDLVDDDALLLQTLQVELAILDGQPEPIQWDLQSPLPNTRSNPILSQRFFRALLRLRVSYQSRIEALAGLEQWLTDVTERFAVQQELLHVLNQMRTTSLQWYRQQERLAGWAELALLSQQFIADLPGFQAALPSWQAQFPDHPALLEPLLQQWETWFPISPVIPQRVAVLLPQDERYQVVSNTIRTGILHQSNQWPDDQQPDILFYDSSQAIPEVYQQAVADGADWVIGPLRKTSVAALLPLTDLSVPVLALNQVPLPDDIPPADIFFMALNPEDEARQAAKRIWSDQYQRPAILAPDNAWGQRLSTAFQTYWSELSDVSPAIAYYDPATFDHGTTIKQLFLSDQSYARHRQIQTWLKQNVEFTPRRRIDIDAIFLIARHVQAQGFAPQLKFHFAGDLPIYATSYAWQGQLNQHQLADMRGIQIPDMPFLASQEALQPVLDATPDQQLRYVRLFALGMDALGILPHIPRLQNDTHVLWSGVTGTLSLNKVQSINRQLTWLQLGNPIEIMPPAIAPEPFQNSTSGP